MQIAFCLSGENVLLLFLKAHNISVKEDVQIRFYSAFSVPIKLIWNCVYMEAIAMKNKNEKKTIQKSLKLSPQQLQQIEEQANKKNMKFSEYMLDCALHHNQEITPCIAVKMQELVNLVREITDCIDSNDFIQKKTLRQKTSAFADLLPMAFPQKKYSQLEKKIDLFEKVGEEVWEFLK